MDRKYLVAVLIAVFVLIVNQAFIQYFLYEKKYDARTINLAGKQRMLSQKINLEFYKGVKGSQASTQLSQLFEEWKSAHYNLLNNTEEPQLSPIADTKALALMTSLSARIDYIERQLKPASANLSVDLAEIDANQTAFLVDMNEVVRMLEETSSSKLRFIVIIEIILMLFSILIIVLEVIFIFRPNHRALVNSLEETRKSKEELRKNLVELQRKNQDLEQFAYAASHDLQEPLRTIISFTQLLPRKYKEQFEKVGKEEMALIVSATRRMKSLITGLLAYTKIGGKRTIKQVDCNALVHTVKQDLNTILTEKQAKLSIEDLPKIMAYETEMRQLFQNLITNALKFQRTEVQPKIIVTGEKLPDKYQFSIQDNGIGISEEYQEQIFAIFKRLHTTDKYTGTGIGLAQCKKIVELHNGQIWVDSKENEGSTFYFTIPFSLS